MHQNRFSETTLSASAAEAIRRSKPIGEWLISVVGGRVGWLVDGAQLVAVHHSYTDAALDSRETDVLVTYRGTSGSLLWILIEMKINAPFGDRQPEDYASRKSKAITSKRCDACAAVVIAPRQYLESHQPQTAHFDVCVALEDIIAIAGTTSDMAGGLLQNHIRIAIDLFEAGYIPLANELREAQLDWYYSFIRGYKSHLVPNPSNASKQARDIFFPVPGQRRGYMTHRIFAGEVAIGFMQRGHLTEEVRDYLARVGDTDVRVELRGSSVYLVPTTMLVPAMDEGRSFAEQEQQLREGIDALDALYRWAERHQDFLAQIVDNRVTTKAE